MYGCGGYWSPADQKHKAAVWGHTLEEVPITEFISPRAIAVDNGDYFRDLAFYSYGIYDYILALAYAID